MAQRKKIELHNKKKFFGKTLNEIWEMRHATHLVIIKYANQRYKYLEIAQLDRASSVFDAKKKLMRVLQNFKVLIDMIEVKLFCFGNTARYFY